MSELFFALMEIAILFRCPYQPQPEFDPRGRDIYDRTRWQEYARAVKPS